MSRIFGLSPDQKSFLFKMLQNLLPTRERQHRCGRVPSPSCAFCEAPEDTIHHLFSCSQSIQVTSRLKECLSDHAGSITPRDGVRMNIKTTESWELPAAWLVATCLQFVWDNRLSGKEATRNTCKAELAARLAILKCSRWKHYTLHNSAVLLEETINLHW